MTESPRGINDPALGAYAEVLAQADRILLIGKPLDYGVQFGRSPFVDAGAKIMMIDPDEAVIEQAKSNLGDPTRFHSAIVASQRSALAGIARATSVDSPADEWHDNVHQAISYRPPEWESISNAAGEAIHAYRLSQAIQRHLDEIDDLVLILDGGESGQWAQSVLHADDRVTNGPSGAIGASLPYALGAKCARPNATVVALMGDGTFGFQPAEIDTAVRYGINCTFIVCNDACWNAEHQIQIRDYGENRTLACELLPTRYDQVAMGFGAHGEYVEDIDALDGALTRALAHDGPSLINVNLKRVAAPVVRRQ